MFLTLYSFSPIVVDSVAHTTISDVVPLSSFTLTTESTSVRVPAFGALVLLTVTPSGYVFIVTGYSGSTSVSVAEGVYYYVFDDNLTEELYLYSSGALVFSVASGTGASQSNITLSTTYFQLDFDSQE